jgi:hypothetical protein
MATLDVQLIRNFEHRSMKAIILRDIDLSITTEQFMELIRASENAHCLCAEQVLEIATTDGYGPFRNQPFGMLLVLSRSINLID